MASTDRIFVSPGVFTSEKDLTFVTRQVGVTTLGLVGETPKGPAFEPVFISDYDEFQKYFGGLNSEKFEGSGFQKYELNYIAKSFLSQTNQLYVTRVLGLSGYKAGAAWSLTIDASIDPDTVVETAADTPLALAMIYSASTGGTPISILWDASASGIEDLYNDGELTSEFSSLGLKTTGETISLTTAKYVKTGSDFAGATFELVITNREDIGGGVITGTTSASTYVTYSGTAYSDVEGSVVATLRSRGAVNSDELMVFDVPVSAATSVDIEGADADTIEKDPLATFTITGTNKDLNTFSYNVSFDNTKKNYITKVLGVSAQDKDSELFVEEIYKNTLDDLNANGKVRGINSSIVQIASDLDDYNEEYTSAVTPYVLSELRGTDYLDYLD